MTSRITGLAVAAPATTALAVAAPSALGGGQRVESEITIQTIDADGDKGGRVRADKPACKWHRKVKLFYRRHPGGKRILEGTDTTGGGRLRHTAAQWGESFRKSSVAHTVFAVVTRKKRRGYICMRDKSNVLTYP